MQLFFHDLNEIILYLQAVFYNQENGTGFALASCRKSLLDMGGDIEVESKYGKGATFVLTVPREYSGKLLAADPIATVVKGEKVRSVYRE